MTIYLAYSSFLYNYTIAANKIITSSQTVFNFFIISLLIIFLSVSYTNVWRKLKHTCFSVREKIIFFVCKTFHFFALSPEALQIFSLVAVYYGRKNKCIHIRCRRSSHKIYTKKQQKVLKQHVLYVYLDHFPFGFSIPYSYYYCFLPIWLSKISVYKIQINVEVRYVLLSLHTFEHMYHTSFTLCWRIMYEFRLNRLCVISFSRMMFADERMFVTKIWRKILTASGIERNEYKNHLIGEMIMDIKMGIGKIENRKNFVVVKGKLIGFKAFFWIFFVAVHKWSPTFVGVSLRDSLLYENKNFHENFVTKGGFLWQKSIFLETSFTNEPFELFKKKNWNFIHTAWKFWKKWFSMIKWRAFLFYHSKQFC